MVTILMDRSLLRPLKNCRDSYKCSSCDVKNEAFLERNKYNDIVANCKDTGYSCCQNSFYKEDILLSYFSLTPNNKKHSFSRVQHFHNSPDYSKIHVTLTRCLKNMWEKDLICLWRSEDQSQRIILTDKGIEKAAEQLHVTDYYIPDRLNDEERESLKRRQEFEYRTAIAAPSR